MRTDDTDEEGRGKLRMDADEERKIFLIDITQNYAFRQSRWAPLRHYNLQSSFTFNQVYCILPYFPFRIAYKINMYWVVLVIIKQLIE
jgi:hypothetical protein